MINISLIGKTPLVELKNIKKQFALKANVFSKLEWYNLTGSVKDRPALKIISEAEKLGLKNGGAVIEATSGNMGISIAAICSLLGYKAVIVMPENMSEERKSIIRAYGAELVETPASDGMKGAVNKAEELNRIIKGSILTRQFENPLNIQAHYETTGPEIFNQLNGKIDVFVAGIGTGGTISGIAKFLKEKLPNIKIIGVEPKSSPLLTLGTTGNHKIQGIGANFIPKTLLKELIDEVIDVSDDNAYEFSKSLTKYESLMCGISSGAALKATCEIANRKEYNGANIVTLFPDSGIKYLSTGLYR